MATLYGPSAPGVRTQTIFSLQVVIGSSDGTTPDVQIGTATELSPNHERSNTLIGGVGIGDRIMEIVPGRSKYSVSLKKFSLWTKKLAEIFGYSRDFRMLAEMQRPFDIKVYHVNPNNKDEVEVTIYRNCVIRSWRRRQEWSDEVVIADDVEVDVTSIDANKTLWPSLSELF